MVDFASLNGVKLAHVAELCIYLGCTFVKLWIKPLTINVLVHGHLVELCLSHH